MHGPTVERNALHRAVGLPQNRAARGLVIAARLHADKAVFNQIEPAHAIFSTNPVEFAQKCGRAIGYPIDGDWIATLKADGNNRRRVGCFFRCDRAPVSPSGHQIGDRLIGVFQHESF